MLSPGVVLSNRYRLEERIGAGGMGDVWRGTDVLLGRPVAVKVLLPSLVSDSEFITRFRAEARLMANLRHPGIVQVYDYGEQAAVGDSRLDYLVMEYVEGHSLSQRIHAAGSLDATETLSVVAQAAAALQVAHDAGIVHRDVKPGNLLVRPDGAVVLVDFGVARSADLTSVTRTHVILGSAHYMAPEQASGQPVTPATDIYALGAVAYHCLTGRPPFTGDNPIQILTQHVQSAAPALPADVPGPVASLVTRALAKNPADRYPSAAALAAAVRSPADADAVTSAIPTAPIDPFAQFPQGPPPPVAPVDPFAPVRPGPPAPAAQVPPPPPPAPAVPPGASANRRRNATLAGIAGVAGVLALGLVAVLAVAAFQRGPDQERTQAATTPSPVNTPASTAAGAGAVNPTERADSGATATPTAPPSATRSPSAATTTEAAPERSSSPKPTASPSGGGTTTNPYTPAQVCGSGYKVIDSANLGRAGKVYLLYNSGNGYNCTVTLKSTSVGTKTAVSATLQPEGGSRVSDSGSFEYYAGPVRAKASGVCVKWGGSTGGTTYTSPFEHCN